MGWQPIELDKKSVFEFFGAGRSGGSGSPGRGVGEKGGVGQGQICKHARSAFVG